MVSVRSPLFWNVVQHWLVVTDVLTQAVDIKMLVTINQHCVTPQESEDLIEASC